jgi:hypothetical protein
MSKTIALLRLWRCTNQNCELCLSHSIQRATFSVASLESTLRESPTCRNCGVAIIPNETPPYSEADRAAFIRKLYAPDPLLLATATT